MTQTRILVAEDDNASARLIEMTLKSLGYAVPAVASSGKEAIKKMAEANPDLALMDIRLKGEMDGVQTAEEIRERFDIPVVYLTAYADDEAMERAKITEPYGYILKPFHKMELHYTIDIALYRHKILRKLKERKQVIENHTAELKRKNEKLKREITKRKKAEEAQERLGQQLQEKVSELETFSYGIAHDLRSPMLSIEGFSRLLRTDLQSNQVDKVQEDIRLIEQGAKKMQQLLNRTLEYSRAGRLVKRTKNVDIGKIIAEVVTEFAGQINAVGATVSVAEDFPRVFADVVRIRQILNNLIQNSINYRDKTRPLKIDIGYWLSGDEAIFFVRDNGTGIDTREMEKIFSLFYRSTSDGDGSGIGLAIVKRIIEAHGGKIWVQDQWQEGTSLCFSLPHKNELNNGGKNGKG